MPKVVIREIDKTQPGFAPASNFTVAIPGFVTDITYTLDNPTPFDENDIAYITSTTEFIQKIGMVQDTDIPASFAILSNIPGSEVTMGPVTYEAYYNPDNQEQFFTGTEITQSEAGQGGYLIAARTTGTDTPVTTYYRLSFANKLNSSKPSGYEKDWDEATNYFYVTPDHRGNDAQIGAVQYGNQIAYLLLTQGYSIFYKKISDVSELSDASTWEAFKDKSLYDFRYVLSGLRRSIPGVVQMSEVNTSMLGLVSAEEAGNPGRGDIIVLLDIPEDAYENETTQENKISAIQSAMTVSSQYAAYFAPTVTYDGITNDVYTNTTLPGSFHYLACASRAFSSYNEWYSVSGYTRGICPFKVVGVSARLGEKAVNALQTRKRESVNLIIPINNSYYLWGNRTAYRNEAGLIASNFLNIRQLCCTLKKTIYQACRTLMFDPNDEILWTNFCNAVRPTLEIMKANQGINDYKFEKKETSLKAKLFAAVRIIPIEAVEDFEIAVTLEDNFDETTISIEEKLVG